MPDSFINVAPSETDQVPGRKLKLLVTGCSGFIGTNTMDYFLEHDVDIMNVDIKGPQKSSHHPYWWECDIMDKATLVDYHDAAP